MWAWCLSGPTKYGLGALVQYPARIYLAERTGVRRSLAVAGLALELAIIALSGVSVLLLLAPLAGDVIVPGASPALRALGPPLALALFLGLPPLARAALVLAPAGPTGRPPGLVADRLRLALLLVVVNWLLLGLGAFCLVAAMGGGAPAQYPAFVVAVTAAMLAGMFAFTPLGLGVREVTMVVLLAQLVPTPIATSAALLHRLFSVLAELLAAGLVLAVAAIRQGWSGRSR
jgi:glycosyltransferase 2 family protein